MSLRNRDVLFSLTNAGNLGKRTVRTVPAMPFIINLYLAFSRHKANRAFFRRMNLFILYVLTSTVLVRALSTVVSVYNVLK